MMPIKSLTPYVKNNKIHSEEQLDLLASMIAEFGFDQPIVVDKKLVLIKGEARWLAAKRLGMSLVPVIVADHLSETQVMASRIADNKVSSTVYDLANLKFDLGTIERTGFDMSLTGLGFDEISDLLKIDDIEQEPLDLVNRTTGDSDVQAFRLDVEFASKDDMMLVYGELINRGYVVRVASK